MLLGFVLNLPGLLDPFGPSSGPGKLSAPVVSTTGVVVSILGSSTWWWKQYRNPKKTNTKKVKRTPLEKEV